MYTTLLGDNKLISSNDIIHTRFPINSTVHVRLDSLVKKHYNKSEGEDSEKDIIPNLGAI